MNGLTRTATLTFSAMVVSSISSDHCLNLDEIDHKELQLNCTASSERFLQQFNWDVPANMDAKGT